MEVSKDREERKPGAPNDDRKFVGSLLHGLAILDLFTRDRREISIGEMASSLGMHKSSASRLASTLAHAGYLRPSGQQGAYRLGGRLASLGMLVQHSVDIVDSVTPHLEQLTKVTGETGHLAVMDGIDAVTLAVTEGWHTIRMHSWVGKTSPAYVSSMGKALLAGLSDVDLADLHRGVEFVRFTDHTVADVDHLVRDAERIRARGYGFDDEELEVGMRCVSAPIVGADGAVVASISVSGPSQRILPGVVEELAAHVRWHAAEASRQLGSRTGVPEWWRAPIASEPAPLSYIKPAVTG
ncbi:IclR family transcriptional regulator [Paramicrobacterium chengjingii]|uniref:IclR family transcriptional regulator n=1 Tax=Paramicrobacterium chengjingii TaxID=2769067 RepID=UPI001424251B|nr:IclR family transcriptional regulator [Microbacterium chengjingii]